MKKIRFTDYIIKYLSEQEDIKYYFGITGKSISAIVDAGENYDNIELITAKHEGGASYMAYGYAQATGKIGVCFGTSGGGSTNLLTGVASAYMNSIPMLVITGQVPTENYGKGAFQESTGIGRTIGIHDIFRPSVKESIVIDNPSRAADLFIHAIRKIHEGRPGPVHINIPINVQLAEIEDKPFPKIKPSRETFTNYSQEQLKAAAEKIFNARNPLIYVGWGVHLSNSEKEILNIAEKYNIPIVSSPQAKGVIRTDHPLYAGIMGLGGHQSAIDYMEKTDILLAVGTSFNEFGTLNWHYSFYKLNDIIQIDIDSVEIGKNFPVSVPLCGNAKTVLSNLFNELTNKGEKDTEIKNIELIYDEPDKIGDISFPFKPQRLMNELRKAVTDNTIFLADSGSHCSWALQYIDILKGGHFFASFGLGAMGVTVAAAMGIKLGKPKQAVVAIVGDGTFAMHGNEIAVASQYNIGVIWVIVNDMKFGMPEAGSKRLYGRAVGTTLSNIDFAMMANAFGIAGYTIDKANEIGEIIKKHIDNNTPAVIDVRIDTSQVPLVGERLDYGDK